MTEVKVIHLSTPFGLEFCTGYLIFEKAIVRIRACVAFAQYIGCPFFCHYFLFENWWRAEVAVKPEELLKTAAKTATSSFVFLWCHSIFLHFLLFPAISLPFPFISSHFFPFLPCFPYGVASMQYAVPFVSLIPALFISIHSSSFDLLSIQLPLFYFVEMCSSFLSDDWAIWDDENS